MTSRSAKKPGRRPGLLHRAAGMLASRLLVLVLAASLVLPLPAHAFYFGGVTLRDEKEMGHKFDVAIRSSISMVEDPEISSYVKNLVARIVRAIPPQPYNFKTGIILHNSMNAFAVPAGYVYVLTGLLMNFPSEDAVAGVLCHELAHVTQRHTAQRLERSQIISLGSLLLAVAGVAVGGGGAAAMGAIGAGQSAMLNYSRADETEADQVGMQYLIKAGYSPAGMVDGFKILRNKSTMMGVNVPVYLSTHPDLGDRITGIIARMHNMPASVVNRRADPKAFTRMQVLLWGRFGTPQTALLRFRGSDGLSLMGRGMVYSRLNNVTEAAKCFSEAVAKSPNDSLVLREAGIFNYRKGSAQTARELLTKALQLDRSDYMASFFLARLQDDEGQHAQAQASFRDVLRAVPEDAEVHEAMARSYGAARNQGMAYIHMTYSALYQHKKEQAKKYFDKAKAIAGTSPEFRKLEKVYKERKEIWEKL